MLAKEGYSTIAVISVFTLLVIVASGYMPFWAQILSITIALAIFGLIIYFFRDPERITPEGESLIISPADGEVVLIKEVEENEYMNSKALQISIFLSPLDVHVNRNPISGTVEYLRYYPGKYLMAWEDHASEQNERAHFGVKHPSGTKMMFKQITGFLARRIVYHLKEGDTLVAGDRFGIMKFGSRMDLLLPLSTKIDVKKGDKTVAGQTVIGTFDHSK